MNWNCPECGHGNIFWRDTCEECGHALRGFEKGEESVPWTIPYPTFPTIPRDCHGFEPPRAPACPNAPGPCFCTGACQL